MSASRLPPGGRYSDGAVCLHCGRNPLEHVRVKTPAGSPVMLCPTSRLLVGCAMCHREVCACKVSKPGTHPPSP